VWHDGEWHVQVKDLISKVQEMFTRPDDISLRATAFADLPCEQGKEILERLLRDKRCCPHKTGLERWLDKEANKLTKPLLLAALVPLLLAALVPLLLARLVPLLLAALVPLQTSLKSFTMKRLVMTARPASPCLRIGQKS
jgi:hypothetical protein